MPGDSFDRNVLLYVASTDPAKTDRAEKLIGTGGMISVQVLNEIANVARRKMRMPWTETRAFLSMIRGLLPVQDLRIEVYETGLVVAERNGLSTYDAMIAASALHAGCDTLWSEDIQEGSCSTAGSASSTRSPLRKAAVGASVSQRSRFALRYPLLPKELDLSAASAGITGQKHRRYI
jgi:predicted nucleic acid-binding protein